MFRTCWAAKTPPPPAPPPKAASSSPSSPREERVGRGRKRAQPRIPCPKSSIRSARSDAGGDIAARYPYHGAESWPALHSVRLGTIGRGLFAAGVRIARNRTATNDKFAFAQGVKQTQCFRDRSRGEVAAQRAFAFENLSQVEAHGVALRNCRSNFRHASTSACRARMP